MHITSINFNYMENVKSVIPLSKSFGTNKIKVLNFIKGPVINFNLLMNKRVSGFLEDAFLLGEEVLWVCGREMLPTLHAKCTSPTLRSQTTLLQKWFHIN